MTRSGAVLLACVLHLSACTGRGEPEPATPMVYGGEPDHAIPLMRQYGCGTCHVIPGMRDARGVVGPPLDRFAYRAYIAGTLENTPENLVIWIVNPQGIQPGTAMPMVGVTEPEARHIAAYLYTLR